MRDVRLILLIGLGGFALFLLGLALDHTPLRLLSKPLPLIALPLQAQAAPGLPVILPSAAQMIGDRVETMGSHPLPTGPWQNGVIPAKQTEGHLRQSAWRLSLDGRSTLELLAPLRAQIAAAGFVPVYECDTLACGGFDFRFGMTVLPEPQMHVDLGDFRYLVAESASGDMVSLLVSFTLTVSNVGPNAAHGAVLRDAPGPGLDCAEVGLAAPTCVASGGAACPGALTNAALLGVSGVAIPALPSGGGVAVTLQCRVTASGLP